MTTMDRLIKAIPSMALPPKSEQRLNCEAESRNILYMINNETFAKDQARWDKAMSDFWATLRQMRKETEELEASL